MPGMDGLETAELIRSRRKSSHTPIIFITAFADEMHTAKGYSLGAVDYILSPVVPNVLRSKVKALVQLHRLNAELRKRADERVALAKEQAARTMAEDAQRRASFLAEATQVMASSLDVDMVLKGASGLAVPFLADSWDRICRSPTASRDAPRARSTTACCTRKSRTPTGARTSSWRCSRTSCATRSRRCAPRCTCCAAGRSSRRARAPCWKPWTA